MKKTRKTKRPMMSYEELKARGWTICQTGGWVMVGRAWSKDGETGLSVSGDCLVILPREVGDLWSEEMSRYESENIVPVLYFGDVVSGLYDIDPAYRPWRVVGNEDYRLIRRGIEAWDLTDEERDEVAACWYYTSYWVEEFGNVLPA